MSIKKSEKKKQEEEKEEEDNQEEKEEEKGIHADDPEDDENVEEMSQGQSHCRSFQDVGVQLSTEWRSIAKIFTIFKK
ncbi:hypothetical protein RF55_19572 [Lasius niger]|uniref:Uncharacterized protein n=1 Tax=Lasius niger TaxID=67767 RepID=A0A0J7K0D7_LASNI|nr:hypothetical protein RF55_19572 [Lasius niger]